MKLELQEARKSLIYKIGLAAAIAQGVLGILMTAGVLTGEMCGAIMTAFAIVLQWANGNNPNCVNTYAPKAVKRTSVSLLADDEDAEEC